MPYKMLIAGCLAALVGLSGCTNFNQLYHFQSSAGDGGVNYFRVRVTGDAQTAKARYVAGFYDERAVDLYFNELKSSGNDIRPIFPEGLKAPGEDAVIKPLSPDKDRGTFVMIFSTNPKAVADTIGSFADSQVVADSLTNLINKRDVEAARILTATQGVAAAGATAVADELAAILPTTASAAAPGPAASTPLTRTYLRALESISRETGGPPSFADFAAAKAWLGRAK